jgi:hypothetical protein
MIGITGKDGAGYRWLPPTASAVHEGRLRVIPYASERAARWWGSFNALLVVAVCAVFSGERLGAHGAWHEVFYRVALAVVLVECLLRLPAWFARRTIQVDGPLQFGPVRQSEWVGWSLLCSTLVLTMVQVKPPVPAAWWDALTILALLANLGLAMSPRFSRWLLRRRGDA